ncbi:hypothetical protein thsrh120_22400 [Rhizobium sp. No.120]
MFLTPESGISHLSSRSFWLLLWGAFEKTALLRFFEPALYPMPFTACGYRSGLD